MFGFSRLSLPAAAAAATITTTVPLKLFCPAAAALFATVAAFFARPPLPSPAAVLQLSFTGLPAAAPATAIVTVIDGSHASALPVWRAQGSPIYPTQAQIAEQLSASQLSPTAVPLTSTGANSASISLTMQPQSVVQVEIVFA